MSDSLVERLRSYRPTNEWGDDVHHVICDEAAARIQALETSLAKAEGRVKKARRQALEEAAKACEAERLCEPQDDSDAAYDNAIDHCAQAIRALADPLLDRQGKEGV